MLVQTASIELVFHENKTSFVIRTPQGTSVIEAVGAHCPGLPYGKVHTGIFKPNEGAKPKKVTPKRNKRASTKQETDIMEALGGRRQAGSGALAHLKGDGRVRDKFRVEAKYTRKDSYRLDRKELSKIRGECTPPEIPLFVIDFVDPETGGSPDRWVTVEFEHFLKMEYQPTHAARHPSGPR